ncbi:Tripartite DNA replication factor [Ascosphaera pollenicola]|nr:Tripartite DNA replication factor [Ascosphaera pollenicola]
MVSINPCSRAANREGDCAISNTSISKLNSFRYGEIRQSAMHVTRDSKSTDSAMTETAAAAAAAAGGDLDKAFDDDAGAGALSKTAEPKGHGEREKDTTSDPPQTTANTNSINPPETPYKLQFSNLINHENPYAATPLTEPSPEDRIVWKSKLSSSVSRGHSPETRNLKTHSNSSPPSSPLAAARSTMPPRGQHAQTSIPDIPPCNDIVAELWNRYIVSTTGKKFDNAIDHPSTDFPPLTPDPVKRDLKLRRAASCNNYWPTTSRKRRRVENGESSKTLTESVEKAKGSVLSPKDSSGESKINFLVGKIQETLKKAPSKLDKKQPSASLPLPQGSALADTPMKPGLADNDAQQSEQAKELPGTDKMISTSELDDFDFNDSMLLDSETSIENITKSSSPIPRKKHSAGIESTNFVDKGRSEFSDDDLDDAFMELATEKTPKQKFNLGTIAPEVPRSGVQKEKVEASDKPLCHIQTKQATAQNQPSNTSGTVKPPSTNRQPQQPRKQLMPTTDNLTSYPTTPQQKAAKFEKPSSSKKQSRSKTFPIAKVETTDGFDDGFDDDIDDIFAELAGGDENAKPDAQTHSATELTDDHQGTREHGEYSDDGFDDLDLADFDTNATSRNFQPCRQKVIQRYHVLDVGESSHKNRYGQIRPEKVLYVQEERTEKHLAVILRDSWFDSPVTKGVYIHVVGDFNRSGQCIVDDMNNMIILHPDHLLSATVVASSFSCMRQAVLQDRIKATDDASKPQVYGMTLHEIFQQALKANRWDLPWLKGVIDKVVINNIEKLYEIEVDVKEATRHLMSKMPHLRKWAQTFMSFEPSSESLMKDRGGATSKMSINKLLEVEEHIWSPVYGLKGNVDATVQVALHEAKGKKTLTIPLEFKTGSKDTSEVHRAQTAMYCLLLSDRYDIDVTYGVLYYLETAGTFRIRAIRQEIIHMIQQRNELADYVRHKLDLPPMIKKPPVCNNCYSKNQCFLYHKLMENGDGETSGMGQKFEEFTDHLTPSHQEFFVKWERLLTLEEQEMMKFRRELWSMLSHEREAVGRCFGGLIVEPDSAIEDEEGPKVNRFKYTFVKKHPKATFTFADSQIGIGEPIVISDEKGHFALANGYVIRLTSKRITVAVDRRLHNSRTQTKGFNAERNQAFTGIMEIIKENGRATTVHPEATQDTNVYRLDKDEFSNGMALVRNNLLSLMDREKFQAKRLRELLIDNYPPLFRSLPASALAAISISQTNLNVDQKNAIEKVLSADDYALVLGMPGTGKTTTIAHIIRALVSKGKSVLLTSYTHTAVDNILLKTRKDGYRTLRIGAVSKIHPEVQEFVNLASTARKSVEELRDVYENSQIVATTCLGVNHPIFNHRVFDYCIVDEASQITLPVCLGPIRLAKTFILVGDHFQLPPLVQNREALEQGLDVSLFRWLCDRQPKSVVYLEHQYRMCKNVMYLSNHLIYNNHLKCGTPEIAAAELKISNPQGLKAHHMKSLKSSLPSSSRREICLGLRQGHCWIRDLIDPSAKARLVNTDNMEPKALEDAKGSRIVNEAEATICAQLVDSLISVGIPASEIGVVTLYRSQLALLKTRLSHRLPDLEMHTADRFQGRDKEIIIMSCVRSNTENNVGDLLRDYRRVNVAFTRARTKLLVVGSKSTLHGGTDLLAKFVRMMDGKGWVYDLPKSAAEQHVFEEQEHAMTQITPRQPTVDKAVDVSSSGVKREYANAVRSPMKAMSDAVTMSTLSSSSSKKVRFSQSAKQIDGGSPLVIKQSRNMNMNARKRQPNKVGAKPLDGAKVISKRPMLRDFYNDTEG